MAPSDALALSSALPEIVCIDLSFGGGIGYQVLQRLLAANPRLPVVAVMAQRDAETAAAAMRAGAYDYVTKPVDRERLLDAVGRANERQELLRSMERLHLELQGRTLEGPLTGHSEAIVTLDALIARVLDRDVAVCLTGEVGSGKELVAQAIHRNSGRRHGPYVSVDCAAIDQKEQEAALFGQDQGTANPGPGAFEQASGGVLFLDHVGALSTRAQAALSSVLATRRVRRVGSGEEVSVSVRVVAAHTEPLRGLVEDGRFREDLYFRLVVYPVEVPALRQRSDDIPLIVSFFLRELSPAEPRHLSPEALEALVRYAWPGNIRELEHVVHRAVLAAREEIIHLNDLPPELRCERAAPMDANEGGLTPHQLLSLPDNEVVPLRDLERIAIEHALRITNGSVGLAAQKLGIGRATLYRRIASLDLSLDVAS